MLKEGDAIQEGAKWRAASGSLNEGTAQGISRLFSPVALCESYRFLEAGPIVRKILEHLDPWDTRNHDPPDEDDSHIAELVCDNSESQIPQYDYWD